MRALFATTLVAIALLMPLPARLARAAPDLVLAVIVHRGNPVQRLSRDELVGLFTRSRTRWSDGVIVVPLNAAASSGLRTTFDEIVLALSSQQVGRFWLDRRIRGLGMPPMQVPDHGMALRVVEHLRGAIAYVPVEPAGQRVKVVARIRQGKVLAP